MPVRPSHTVAIGTNAPFAATLGEGSLNSSHDQMQYVRHVGAWNGIVLFG